MLTHWISADRAIIGDSRTVVSPAWIGINGELIESVTDQKPDQIETSVSTDLGDATLTPGLFNLHDHICRKYLRDTESPLSFSQRSRLFMAEDTHYLLLHSVYNAARALDEGITYIRDYGLGGHSSIHLRRAIKEGLIVGPDISACGQPICMTGGHTWRQALQADGPENIRAAVRAEIRAGADIIKFMASGGLEHFPVEDPQTCELTLDEMRAGSEAAHSANIMTSAHAYPTRAILNTIRAGVDVVEHGVMIDSECINEMLKYQTALVPTLTGLRNVARFLPPTPDREEIRAALDQRIFQPHARSIHKAVNAGVLVGTGTDTSGRLADEIRLLMQITECTPVKALAHATGISAQIIRRPDLGLLAEGKKANIAAFPGDLTRSLDTLDRAIAVWKAGEQVVG